MEREAPGSCGGRSKHRKRGKAKDPLPAVEATAIVTTVYTYAHVHTTDECVRVHIQER